MSVSEVSLDNGTVGVETLPPKDINGARESTKDEHGTRDCEDASCENDLKS